MKILFVHNKYQQAGGEDSVVFTEINLLRNFGGLVELAFRENDVINSIYSKASVFFSVTYSLKSKLWMTKKIESFSPDIVHIHNYFPLLSPSIYDACIEAAVPVVQTLHNYRTICPGALLMRGGQVCELCVSGSPYQAILHCCYRNSILGTLAVARMVSYHRSKGTWREKIDRFIALTDFAKNKFVEAGFPEEKIVVKPNFVENPLNIKSKGLREAKALFVGRISQEKGVSDLMSAWDQLDYPLLLAGDGPEFERFKNSCNNNAVTFLGAQAKEKVYNLMTHSQFLVMPSICYEGFPLVLVEAFAHGLPVICSCLGSMAEIVEDGVTGLHFEAGNPDDLSKKVEWMISHSEECREMGENARATYLEKYTPEINYKILMDIYQEAIDFNKGMCRKS